MRRSLFIGLVFVLSISWVLAASVPNSGPERDAYEARKAAEAAGKFKIAERPANPTSFVAPLSQPVLSLAYYPSTFEGYVDQAFGPSGFKTSFIAIENGQEKYHENSLTEYLATVKSRWPYLRAYVDSRNPKAYQYEVWAVPTDPSMDWIPMIQRRGFSESNVIPLDIASNARLEVNEYKLGWTGWYVSGRKTVAKVSVPLGNFYNQLPKYRKILQDMKNGYFSSSDWGELMIDKLPADESIAKIVNKGMANFVLVVWDQSIPQAPRAICTRSFSKLLLKKGPVLRWTQVPSTARTPDWFKDTPPCALEKLTSKDVELFEKSQRAMRPQFNRRLDVAIIPLHCPTQQGGTVPCARRFFSYEVGKSRDGSPMMLATDLETQESRLISGVDPNNPQAALEQRLADKTWTSPTN